MILAKVGAEKTGKSDRNRIEERDRLRERKREREREEEEEEEEERAFSVDLSCVFCWSIFAVLSSIK